MKPPICEVCNSRFDRAGGEQVSFVVDESTRSYDIRAEQPGFVGHRPNSGWFCTEHLAAAQARSGSMTLGDAVRDIAGRSGFRPEPVVDSTPARPLPDALGPVDPWPVEPTTIEGSARCATCAVVFPEGAGGAVDFFVKHVIRPPRFDYPNRRWFCSRHLGPAMMIRATIGVGDARPLLQPSDRNPFEYNEAPTGVEIGAVDDHGEPQRGPFIPMPDTRLHAEVTQRVVRVAPRVGRDAELILHRAIADIGRALAVDHLRFAGSVGLRDDATEARLRPARAQRCSTSVSSSHGSDLAVFKTTVRYLVDGETRDEATVLGEHVRLLVQQRETSVLELVVVAGDRAEFAPDGQPLLDHVQVRVAPSHEAKLEGVVDELLEALGVAAFDPFELGPDIEGVDLRGGAIRRSVTGKSRIEWTLAPVSVAAARERFLQLLPTLVDDLGLGTMPELERVDRRDWNPMDGSVAPNCPYVDYVTFHQTGPDNQTIVSVHSEQSHWSDNDISSVSAGFLINLDGTIVSAYAAGRGAHDACTVLSLRRPTSPIVIDALTSALEPWLKSGS